MFMLKSVLKIYPACLADDNRIKDGSILTVEPPRGKTNNVVSEQVQHKLEISDLSRRGKFCTIQVAKTKALISFAVTAKLICVFVFAYADSWFFP